MTGCSVPDDKSLCQMNHAVWCEKKSYNDGYSASDRCMLLGEKGKDSTTIVWSLTDEPNHDYPIQGISATPPTWGMTTFCEMAKGGGNTDAGSQVFAKENCSGGNTGGGLG